jgi:hypothetical protein
MDTILRQKGAAVILGWSRPASSQSGIAELLERIPLYYFARAWTNSS